MSALIGSFRAATRATAWARRSTVAYGYGLMSRRRHGSWNVFALLIAMVAP
jgi:hypothetical protein